MPPIRSTASGAGLRTRTPRPTSGTSARTRAPPAATRGRPLIEAGAPRTLVVALNDAIADGRDVSWIWDVDFEPLFDGLERLVATGERSAELALRFKYGGLDESRIEVVPELGRALDRGLELTPDGGELVLLPTYT